MSSPPHVPTFTLSNGVQLPSLGLGTYRLKGTECREVVKNALKVGYRLIDTAAVYKNESDVGAAVQELVNTGEITREQVFITTKISPKDQGFDKAYAAGLTCLSNLGLSYIDLLLIHWPGTQGRKPTDPRNTTNRQESWRALEKLYKEGRVRAIGVSNFTVEHLKGLIKVAEIVPHVNQFEFHPCLYKTQHPLVTYCKSTQIQPQAYSSFGEGHLLHSCLNLNTKCTRAQILLVWALRQSVGVIPKASSLERLIENLGAVELDEDVEGLEVLDGGEKRFCWDPTSVI
ncbi:uncharacterized protein SPPG_02144 [Spizellomyces punctatus DAOM BR117]|uniref:NADP-dependent oxidoreductase domain-containing protein n=1 Tax=Spizellomyces punctatus (strain DAOM BR117) TaxID=645134 RepID=A0A0L0HQL0_SPIPD|nr:uncharacterized protein SPPG_02144 [Spizellomyces punctatus DAOM BR117]KND03079.1 hypothetical protein SPPG_02144 [Spizellomyces punctatus DAOM BR117]|eukprot:XP_016611118.1 hypothetical protein SPPG_02144 [Spizellomyces punctatus DAOM BR117]